MRNGSLDDFGCGGRYHGSKMIKLSKKVFNESESNVSFIFWQGQIALMLNKEPKCHQLKRNYQTFQEVTPCYASWRFLKFLNLGPYPLKSNLCIGLLLRPPENHSISLSILHILRCFTHFD